MVTANRNQCLQPITHNSVLYIHVSIRTCNEKILFFSRYLPCKLIFVMLYPWKQAPASKGCQFHVLELSVFSVQVTDAC